MKIYTHISVNRLYKFYNNRDLSVLLHETIKKVRAYKKDCRHPDYDDQFNTWDCGRQDAYCDSVRNYLTDFYHMKIAYRLKQNQNIVLEFNNN